MDSPLALTVENRRDPIDTGTEMQEWKLGLITAGPPQGHWRRKLHLDVLRAPH